MTNGETNFCRGCGKKVEPDGKFCSSCGAPLSAVENDDSSASSDSPLRNFFKLLALLVIAVSVAFWGMRHDQNQADLKKANAMYEDSREQSRKALEALENTAAQSGNTALNTRVKELRVAWEAAHNDPNKEQELRQKIDKLKRDLESGQF